MRPTIGPSVVREIWDWVRPEHDRAREKFDLLTSHAIRDGVDDALRIGLAYFRITRDGDIDRRSYRTHHVDIDGRRLRTGRCDPHFVIDEIKRELQYLVAVVRPPHKPKGFRLLRKKGTP